MKRAKWPWLGPNGMAYLIDRGRMFCCGNRYDWWLESFQRPDGSVTGLVAGLPMRDQIRLDKLVEARQ